MYYCITVLPVVFWLGMHESAINEPPVWAWAPGIINDDDDPGRMCRMERYMVIIMFDCRSLAQFGQGRLHCWLERVGSCLLDLPFSATVKFDMERNILSTVVFTESSTHL
jgi:hypothetical protein